MKNQREIEEGARLLREGGLVLFPTETVYGLGGDARNQQACLRIFEAKGRPADNPLIVHLASREQLASVCEGAPPEAALRALELFSPGPLTVVVRHNRSIADAATTGLPTVAVRIPAHPVARALLAEAAIPVAAPSANRSGRPSPTTYEMAVDAMAGRVDLILDGGACEVGLESTILDCTGDAVRILRPGGVTREMLLEAGFDLAPVESGGKSHGDSDGDGAYLAPGSRYRHYRPAAEVLLLDPGDHREAQALLDGRAPGSVLLIGRNTDISQLPAGVRSHAALGSWRAFRSCEEYARSVYDAFFQADREGLQAILALLPAPEGLGIAIRDRLDRAGRRL